MCSESLYFWQAKGEKSMYASGFAWNTVFAATLAACVLK